MAKAKAKKAKLSKSGARGYHVLVLTKKGDDYTARRVGRLPKGVASAEILALLKKLAPKKSTTAVAVTKTGTIHLAARARKAGGKNKTSQKAARSALKTKKTKRKTTKRKTSKR